MAPQRLSASCGDRGMSPERDQSTTSVEADSASEEDSLPMVSDSVANASASEEDSSSASEGDSLAMVAASAANDSVSEQDASAASRGSTDCSSDGSSSASCGSSSVDSEGDSDEAEVWEICCSPSSTITQAAKARGLKAKRLTLETGHDFMLWETVLSVRQRMKKRLPRRVWASIPCTKWSAIQNLNQKPSQRAALKRARKESRVLLRNVLHVLKSMVGPRRHMYFEWPTRCHGWRLRELAAFRSYCIARGYPVYRVRIDGCMYGLMSKRRPGTYLKKAWTVLTTDPQFESACGRCCCGGHPHTVIMGSDTNASGFYPKAMGEAIARHWDPSADS